MGAPWAQSCCGERTGPAPSHSPETTVVTARMCPARLGEGPTRPPPTEALGLCGTYLGLLEQEGGIGLLGAGQRPRIQKFWRGRVGVRQPKVVPTPLPSSVMGQVLGSRWGEGWVLAWGWAWQGSSKGPTRG